MTKSALLIALFALLAISAPLAAESNFSLPDFGDSGGRLISPSQERILGGAFFRSLHSQMRIIQDPEIPQYIDSLGN